MTWRGPLIEGGRGFCERDADLARRLLRGLVCVCWPCHRTWIAPWAGERTTDRTICSNCGQQGFLQEPRINPQSGPAAH